jgi:DNA-binding response OmpR family regulator
MRHRVLLADPDRALAEGYRRFLARRGFWTASVADGWECLDQLRHFAPDVLVLDPELPCGPWVGGLADRDAELVPVIILSARPEAEGVGGFRVFPPGTYHRKPLAPDVLAQSIRGLLKTLGQWQAKGGWGAARAPSRFRSPRPLL